jgi:hypothetical protein
MKDIKTYRIRELCPQARRAAIDSIKNSRDFKEREIDLDWLVRDLEEELDSSFGLWNTEISFSGFWSQGDGASFTARVDDIPKFIKSLGIEDEILPKVLEAIEETYEMNIVRMDSRYVHENTVRFEIEEMDETQLVLMSPFGVGDITVDLNEVLEEMGLEKKASEWVKRKSKEIYRKLENAYEWEFSDEAALEESDLMELRFDEEGKEVIN